MNKAVIALGSNIEPEMYIKAALEAISQAFSLLKKSKFVYTKPVGYTKQADFLNGAVLIETSDDQSEIVSTLKQIEARLGRQKKGNKYGPRRIDLDLILFNEQIVDEDVYERDFLSRSICEVLPHFDLPV